MLKNKIIYGNQSPSCIHIQLEEILEGMTLFSKVTKKGKIPMDKLNKKCAGSIQNNFKVFF